jgi:chromosome segregation ATPase
MVCSLVKKGLVGAALGAGTLFLVFGTHAPSYVKAAFHKVRRDAHNRVPVRFDIDRARDDIARLVPAIRENMEVLARVDVEAERLGREIDATRANLDRETKAMLAARDNLKKGEFRLAGHARVLYTEAELKADLGRRLDNVKRIGNTLASKEATYKAKQTEVGALRQQLETTIATKKTLTTKLDEIEARLRMIEATQTKNEFDFDDSALARAKETVTDLEKRLEILARRAEMEGRYAEGLAPAEGVDASRDVVKEIDAEFGQSAADSTAKTSDKSL